METAPTTVQRELEEARESLSYWERRERSLGRRARSQRREAARHAAASRERVAELERAAYGPGARGVLAQIAAEGRLPEPTRQAGRRLARRGRKVLVVGVATIAVTTVLVVTTLVLVVLVLLGAL